MSRIVLMAEAGADIPPELANRCGIHMNVSYYRVMIAAVSRTRAEHQTKISMGGMSS